MKRFLAWKHTPMIGAQLVCLFTIWLFHNPFFLSPLIVGVPLAFFVYLFIEAAKETLERERVVSPPQCGIYAEEDGSTTLTLPFEMSEDEKDEIMDWMRESPYFLRQRLRETRQFKEMIS